MDENKVEKISKLASDWWGRHNITTRSVVLVTLILFAGTIILAWTNQDVKHFDKIINVLSDLVLWLTVAIIAGVNGASVVLDKIIQLKKKG